MKIFIYQTGSKLYAASLDNINYTSDNGLLFLVQNIFGMHLSESAQSSFNVQSRAADTSTNIYFKKILKSLQFSKIMFYCVNLERKKQL